MANKRSLKRSITIICEEIFAECVAASLYGNNRQSAEALIYSTIRMQDNFIRRISHPEPGMQAKAYYRILIEHFNNDVNDIVDQISNTHS